MTQDEIIEMARQAWSNSGERWFEDRAKAFEAFAKLVAKKEREACAKVCDELDKADETFYRELSDASVCATAIRARGQAS